MQIKTWTQIICERAPFNLTLFRNDEGKCTLDPEVRILCVYCNSKGFCEKDSYIRIDLMSFSPPLNP